MGVVEASAVVLEGKEEVVAMLALMEGLGEILVEEVVIVLTAKAVGEEAVLQIVRVWLMRADKVRESLFAASVAGIDDLEKSSENLKQIHTKQVKTKRTHTHTHTHTKKKNAAC